MELTKGKITMTFHESTMKVIRTRKWTRPDLVDFIEELEEEWMEEGGFAGPEILAELRAARKRLERMNS